jgi:K(+)-stimulated pyrophosphate-energized sodium pump
MFNRVAGGNFTKAADISSDIVGKNKMDLPEDDQKNPSTAADQVGDNVNDVAGNESDLLESTVATLGSSIVIANLVFHINGATNMAMLNATISFPLILSASGLLACLIALVYAFLHKSKGNPGKELDMVLTLSAVLTMAAGVGAGYFLFGTGNVALYEDFKLGWLSPAVAAGLGVLAGIAIGKITEYYTSGEFGHVKELADMSKEGTAFVVTLGDALGSRSCLIPMILIAVSTVISYMICGMYGIAVAAVGMLSFVASTVSVDAFGPIADNAGGIAEASGLPEEVRDITDELDATGNTTAAIGKGFAIGSAAFATSSLIVGYVGSYQSGEPTLNAVSPLVLAGLIIGAALVEYFCGMLSKNTIKAAQAMADESLKQLEDDRIMKGEILPDYNKCIKLATNEALHHMVAPSVLALAVPAVVGVIAGPEVVGGMILGATVVAIPRAIFMGNSGGAFDNAKKLVEQGRVKYADGTVVKKGSPEHKCAVDGDTVGDTRKDVVGVDLDIFIKMMSTVANIMAPIFRTIHLFG